MTEFSRWIQFILLATCMSLVACRRESLADEAAEEKILILGNSAEPKGLDPHMVSGVIENNILRALFEGLVVEDPNDDQASLPGVAERWESDAEAKRWVFHLRKNAKWSDGKAVTAHDFVFSYHRILNPKLAARYSAMLHPIKNAKAYNENHLGYLLCVLDADYPVAKELLGKVAFRPNDDLVLPDGLSQKNYDMATPEQKALLNTQKGLDQLSLERLREIASNLTLLKWPEGLQDDAKKQILDTLIRYHNEGKKDLWEQAQVGVKALNDHTLELEMRGPVPYLPHLLKHYTWFPVPRHVVEKYGSATEKLNPWAKEEHFISNGAFRLKSWQFNRHLEVEQNPYYWDVEMLQLKGIRFLPITNTYTESRMFFNRQIHGTYGLAAEMISMAKEKRPQALRQESYVGIGFLRLNVQAAGLEDVRVRQALSLAVNREALIGAALRGGQLPAHSITPPLAGYEPPRGVSYDLKKAKHLLAEAGFANGKQMPQLELLITDKDTAKAMAEVLQSMWKEIGVNVNIKQQEWKSYLSSMERGDYSLAIGGWIGDYLDPSTFLEMWRGSDGNNQTHWRSSEYEALLDQANQIADQTQRSALMQKAESIVLRDMAVMPIFYYNTNYLMDERVKGWHPLLLNCHPYKFVSFEP